MDVPVNRGAVEWAIVGHQQVRLSPENDAEAEKQGDVGATPCASEKEAQAHEGHDDDRRGQYQMPLESPERGGELRLVARVNRVRSEKGKLECNQQGREEEIDDRSSPTTTWHR